VVKKRLYSYAMSKATATRLVTLVATGALLASLTALAWLGFCARLTEDDYGWAMRNPAQAIDVGVVGMYLCCWGRYSSTFFLAFLLPMRHMVEWLPAAVLGLWLLALLLSWRIAIFNGVEPWTQGWWIHFSRPRISPPRPFATCVRSGNRATIGQRHR